VTSSLTSVKVNKAKKKRKAKKETQTILGAYKASNGRISAKLDDMSSFRIGVAVAIERYQDGEHRAHSQGGRYLDLKKAQSLQEQDDQVPTKASSIVVRQEHLSHVLLCTIRMKAFSSSLHSNSPALFLSFFLLLWIGPQ
jgi:hypothetical protein